MITRYYAFANNLPLIDSENLKWLIHTLKGFYSDSGTITIVDQNKTLVSTLNLKQIYRHHYNYPQGLSQQIFSAVNQGIYNDKINASVAYVPRYISETNQR